MRNKKLPLHRIDLDKFNEDFEWTGDFPYFVEEALPVINPEIYLEYGVINEYEEYKEHIDAITRELDDTVDLNQASFHDCLQMKERSFLETFFLQYQATLF